MSISIERYRLQNEIKRIIVDRKIIGQRIAREEIEKPLNEQGFDSSDIQNALWSLIKDQLLDRYTQHSDNNWFSDLKLTAQGLESWIEKTYTPKELRHEALKACYELSHGKLISLISRTDIASALGFLNYNDGDLIDVLVFLEKKGFLKTITNLEYQITVDGIEEAEGGFVSLNSPHKALSVPTQPGSIRLSSGQPATNMIKLADLVGKSTITAIYDPYLDYTAMKVMVSLKGLNVRFAQDLRCLTSPKGAERLDISFANQTFAELGVNGTVKLTGKDAHRRFFVLDKNKTLIIGASLNDLNKDEAAHIESSDEDIRFFEAQWSTGKSIPTQQILSSNRPPTKKPVVDFNRGFIHASDSHGRKIQFELVNSGEVTAYDIETNITYDEENLSEKERSPFRVASILTGATSGSLEMIYSYLKVAKTELTNPRVVFSYKDADGNQFESSRLLIQDVRADGEYNLNIGSFLGCKYIGSAR